jgi:hypothetical protein
MTCEMIQLAKQAKHCNFALLTLLPWVEWSEQSWKVQSHNGFKIPNPKVLKVNEILVYYL